jgi:hypothetical protein
VYVHTYEHLRLYRVSQKNLISPFDNHNSDLPDMISLSHVPAKHNKKEKDCSCGKVVDT